jgi:thiosulfate/3-mercaptopyruvate sulfurtransferase
MSRLASPLVTTEFLAEELGAPDLRVVDASWHMPATGRNPREEFEARHIPGAVFFDIDGIAQKDTTLPHMAASPESFAKAVGELGIADTDRVVVYDAAGLMSAARAWWNFRIMGAAHVFVLKGGLPKWVAEGRKLESGPSKAAPATFRVRPDLGQIVSREEMLRLAGAPGAVQIVDVRSAARFNKEVDEPRPGLRRGHIPRSRNLPFGELIENGTLKEAGELLRKLKEAGVDPEKPVVTTCGSGVTAPILNLALAELGYDRMQVYDGSWAEWGADPKLPIE